MSLPIPSLSVMVIILMTATGFSTVTAQEKGYPNKPVTIINPLPVGGGVDIALRSFAKEMQTYLGQPVLVESRLAVEVLLLESMWQERNRIAIPSDVFSRPKPFPRSIPLLEKHLIPNTYEGLKPVVRDMCLLYDMPSRAGAPWKNLNEFIKYVQDNPNKVRYGHTTGIDHPRHLLSCSLFKRNPLQVIEIPFKGA